MKNRIIQLWKSDQVTIRGTNSSGFERSFAGRILNSLTFIVVIICLGLWITAFLLLKENVFKEALSGSILTDLTCLTFFGGLAFAICIGALAGNFLRRAFWKRLTRKRKL